eukprot:6200553-Pleurochrysis_carterae.AAC.5
MFQHFCGQTRRQCNIKRRMATTSRGRVVDLGPDVREGDPLAHAVLVEDDAGAAARRALDVLLDDILHTLRTRQRRVVRHSRHQTAWAERARCTGCERPRLNGLVKEIQTEQAVAAWAVESRRALATSRIDCTGKTEAETFRNMQKMRKEAIIRAASREERWQDMSWRCMLKLC